jgi:hypothetical protein
MSQRSAIPARVTPMTEVRFPGVYVEEVPTHAHPIDGVATSTAAFAAPGPPIWIRCY